MEYEQVIQAKEEGRTFELPVHGDSTYAATAHTGEGWIDILGEKEAELVCLTCTSHFLAVLATIEDPDTITPWPDNKVLPK